MSESENILSVSTFASLKVTWNIERFSFAVLSIHPVLSAPFEFHADERTNWSMRLDVPQQKDEMEKVKFTLERISVKSDSGDVEVDFVVVLGAGLGDRKFAGKHMNRRFGRDDKKQIVEVELVPLVDILNYTTPFKAEDTVSIECYMVFPSKDRSSFSPPSYGLKCLSEDLMSLRDGGKLYDVTLQVENQEIKAHKAILSSSETFLQLMEERESEAEESKFPLSDMDYEAVSNFVNLKYSGNINYAFGYASAHMLKCLEYFNFDILKYYRSVEHLELRTRFHEEPHGFHWVIKSFNLKKDGDIIESPLIKRLNVNITWKLKVTVKAEEISIFAEIVEGEEPQLFCLEFCIRTGDYEKIEHVNCRRLLRKKDNCQNLGFESFAVKQDVITGMLSEDGDLYVIFGVRTSDGTSTAAVVRRNLPHATPIAEPAYENLSCEMKKLLVDKKFCDMQLKVEEQFFNVHRCVLSARSIAFAEKINIQSSANSPIPYQFIVKNITSEMFNEILLYLYSGVLKTKDEDRLIQLYVASDSLGIASLKKDSCDALKGKNIKLDEASVKAIAEERGGKILKVIEDLSSLSITPLSF